MENSNDDVNVDSPPTYVVKEIFVDRIELMEPYEDISDDEYVNIYILRMFFNVNVLNGLVLLHIYSMRMLKISLRD